LKSNVFREKMNILIFGPNGSGKGVQSSLIIAKHDLKYIDVGELLRNQIIKNTPLGLQVQKYVNHGVLVPDEITTSLVLSEIQKAKSEGWLLDGFPRNINQAKKLYTALNNIKLSVDYVIELILDRAIARDRILGRRICTNSCHHPNNIHVREIMPNFNNCRICGHPLKSRTDDQNLQAIEKRHDIYYDQESGALAAANYFKHQTKLKYISINANRPINEISNELLSHLQNR
jgi:adenylate kinase